MPERYHHERQHLNERNAEWAANTEPEFRYILPAPVHDEFVRMLDAPTKPSPKLAELFSQPAPWDEAA